MGKEHLFQQPILNTKSIPTKKQLNSNSSLALLRGCAFRKKKKNTEFQTGIGTIEHLDLHDLANCFQQRHLGRSGIPTIHWTLLGLMLRKAPTQRKVIFRASHDVQNRADVNKNIPNLSLPVLVAKFVADKKTSPRGFGRRATRNLRVALLCPGAEPKVLRYYGMPEKPLKLSVLKWEGGKCLKNHSKIT